MTGFPVLHLVHICLAGLVYIFPGTSLTAQASVAEGLRDGIETMMRMETDFSFEKCPGFLVGIIDNEMSHIFSFGHATPGETDTLDDTGIFEVGSVTKPVVATVAALLDQDGLLPLEHRVNASLPQPYRNGSFKDLTLLDLLTHRSGFPRYPAMFGDYQRDPRDPYASFSREQLLAFYRDFAGARADFAYSHVNYALVEVLIEEHLGTPFQEVLKKKLLDPLGMKDSGLGEHITTTPGYDLGGHRADPWSFRAFAASEGLKSSMPDMLKFVRYTLAHAPESVLREYSKTTFEKDIRMALGWYIVKQRKDVDVYAHSGYTTGHYCFVALVPKTQTAVVIMANSSAGVEDLGFHVLRMINLNWKRKSDG